MSETTNPETPEGRARDVIDSRLKQAGWKDLKENGNSTKTGFETEYPTENGPADYVLLLDGQPVAIIEAKKKSQKPHAALEQSARYARAIDTEKTYRSEFGVPFLFSSNGKQTWIRDVRKDSRNERKINEFHTPKGLAKYIQINYSAAKDWLQNTEIGTTDPDLWENQRECIEAIEEEIQLNKNNILIQMATGTGKTRMAIALTYRLLKSNYAQNVLFLADRSNLVNQAYGSFEGYRPADTALPLSKLYEIQKLEDSNDMTENGVTITTLQKMYSLVAKRGDVEFDLSLFDVIVTDECHRSIYGDYKTVLDTFDATEIGLTATPAKHTIGYFDGLTYSYDYRDGVRDGKIVPFVTHRIRTKITMEGVEDGQGGYHSPDSLGVSVQVPQTNIKIGQEFRENMDSEDELTLVFAQNDAHADQIVKDFRRMVFSDKPSEYVQKITTYADRPEETLIRFRNRHDQPTIAVTVDMVTTGVDVKPLENIILVRPVKSPVLYNQMMGRGTRTCPEINKDLFTIYDCVGALDHFADEGIPPFNTTDFDPGRSTASDSESEQEVEDITVVDVPDEVVESKLLFPTRAGEELTAAEFQSRFESFIAEQKTEWEVLEQLVEDESISEDELHDFVSELHAEPEHFSEQRLRKAYKEDMARMADFILHAITGEPLKSPEERVERAYNEIYMKKDFDSSKERWLEEMRPIFRAEGNVERVDFQFPPLSTLGGWQKAVEDFGGELKLEEIIADIESRLVS